MPTIDVVDRKNKKVGEISLRDDLFGITPHMGALHQVVRSQMAAARAGTASTKTRSEVSYAGGKPYRQKGTGRARAGFRGSPVWRGGGTIFGPRPRKYRVDVPKKVRQLALRSALSSKAREGNLIVVDELSMEAPRTRDLLSILKDLNLSGKILIVTGDFQEALALSGRNVPRIAVLEAHRLNVYDILNMEKVLMTRDAVEKLSEAIPA